MANGAIGNFSSRQALRTRNREPEKKVSWSPEGPNRKKKKKKKSPLLGPERFHAYLRERLPFGRLVHLFSLTTGPISVTFLQLRTFLDPRARLVRSRINSFRRSISNSIRREKRIEKKKAKFALTKSHFEIKVAQLIGDGNEFKVNECHRCYLRKTQPSHLRFLDFKQRVRRGEQDGEMGVKGGGGCGCGRAKVRATI